MDVLWFLIIAFLGIGIYALQAAIRYSFKNVENKNMKGRLVRAVLEETGYRYFVGLIGVVFIAVGLFATLTFGLGVKIGSDNPKTDIVEIAITPVPGSNTSSTMMATIPQLKITYQYLGDSVFQTYHHVSFRNHYLEKLPDLLWKMTNVELIDLTNNEFTEFPLDELTKLTKLKKLVLDGNPIESAYLEQVRSKLSGVEVIKTEAVKPGS